VKRVCFARDLCFASNQFGEIYCYEDFTSWPPIDISSPLSRSYPTDGEAP
jgi:hypothetical protein